MSKPKTTRDISIPDSVFSSLLTASELRMLKNRWQILNLLQEGLSVRKIAANVKVGTDTVVRVARLAEKEGLRRQLNKTTSKIRTSTPWIFGKSE